MGPVNPVSLVSPVLPTPHPLLELAYYIYLILALEVIYSEQNTGSTYIFTWLFSDFGQMYILWAFLLAFPEMRNLVGIFRDEISCWHFQRNLFAILRYEKSCWNLQRLEHWQVELFLELTSHFPVNQKWKKVHKKWNRKWKNVLGE